MRSVMLWCLALVFALMPLSPARADERAALTVNGSEISASECTIYMLNAENRYAEVAAYYKDFLGIDYWSLSYANGMTAAEMVKADVFKELLMMNVFYQMALELRLSATDEEKQNCAEDARAYYASLPVARAGAFTAQDVESLLLKQLLADRMYSMLLGQTEIDEDVVRGGVEPENYVTYDVEYLFRQKTDYDENGATVDIGTEKREQILEALRSAAKEMSLAQAAEAYAALDILSGSASFTCGDQNIDERLMRAASALAVGESSDVIETDFGWFLIRLVDNTSTTAYDAAVESALYDTRVAAFKDTYDDLYSEAEYEINVDFWDTLSLEGAPAAAGGKS